jgi:hypothetical protein
MWIHTLTSSLVSFDTSKYWYLRFDYKLLSDLITNYLFFLQDRHRWNIQPCHNKFPHWDMDDWCSRQCYLYNAPQSSHWRTHTGNLPHCSDMYHHSDKYLVSVHIHLHLLCSSHLKWKDKIYVRITISSNIEKPIKENSQHDRFQKENGTSCPYSLYSNAEIIMFNCKITK